MKEWTGAYVAHYCKKCDEIFIAEDYTKATTIPPRWRYCKKCCAELGIEYEKQTPNKNRTTEENERYKKRGEVLREKLEEKRKQNIKI